MFSIYSLPFDPDSFRYQALPKYVFCSVTHSLLTATQKHPREIHLCVAIVKYRTKLRIPRKGVCTSFLAAVRPGR